MKTNNQYLLKFSDSFILFLIFLCSNLTGQSKTEVLILGTMHISQIKDANANMLTPVINELDQFNFDVVGIENMSFELINDINSRNDSTFFDLVESFGRTRLDFAAKYQDLLGLSFVESQKKLNQLLLNKSFTQIERSSLIQYFLASGDLASAVLQVKYLNNDFEFLKEFIDDLAIKELKKLSNSLNEIYSVGLQVAYREGKQRLDYIDNLQDESILLSHFPDFMSDYIANQEYFEDINKKPVFRTLDSLVSVSIVQNDFTPLFLYMNGDVYQTENYKTEWEIWLKTQFQSKSDLSRFALWEMRNLQIAANIQKLIAFNPGKRILIIIGGSHKYFIEKQLAQCTNVELLNFENVLNQ